MNIVVRHRTWKGSLSSGLLSAFICTCVAVLLLPGCGGEKKAAPQAPVVEIVEVARKDVPVYAEWVATLDGMVNATIKAQVQGYLVKQTL